MIWWIILIAYEIGTLVFWQWVFYDEQIVVVKWILGLLLSWILVPIMAITMLIVYTAEQY